MDKDTQTKIFQWAALSRLKIIGSSKYLYLAITIFWIFATYVNLNHGTLEDLIYKTGLSFGKIAILLLGIIVLPGILGRLKIEIKLTRIITLFRRQLGITAFLIAFTHFTIVRGTLYLTGLNPLKTSTPLFVLMGTGTLFILFFMFLTSNNLSQKKLGKWWKKLHRLIYIVLWLLVLHTGLQKISIWSVYIFIFASLEVISWIYHLKNQKTTASNTQPHS